MDKGHLEGISWDLLKSIPRFFSFIESKTGLDKIPGDTAYACLGTTSLPAITKNKNYCLCWTVLLTAGMNVLEIKANGLRKIRTEGAI